MNRLSVTGLSFHTAFPRTNTDKGKGYCGATGWKVLYHATHPTSVLVHLCIQHAFPELAGVHLVFFFFSFFFRESSIEISPSAFPIPAAAETQTRCCTTRVWCPAVLTTQAQSNSSSQREVGGQRKHRSLNPSD